MDHDIAFGEGCNIVAADMSHLALIRRMPENDFTLEGGAGGTFQRVDGGLRLTNDFWLQRPEAGRFRATGRNHDEAFTRFAKTANRAPASVNFQ